MATKADRTGSKGARTPAAAPVVADEDRFLPASWLIASYAVLSLILFLPALMPGSMLFGTDYLAISYIFERFVTERFAAGELPKWMPYVYGGVPFFANPMDIYYPVTLLLRLLRVPTHHHLTLLFAAQLFLAGTGTYLLLRELGTRRMPAYLAGLLYMFAGYIVSYVYAGHEGRAIVATLAPLLLFTLHRAVRTGGPRWFVASGAVMGASHLSNQIQSNYYLLIGAFLWFLFCLWHLGAHRPARTAGLRLGGGVLAVLIGFALAAINYLPFAGYIDDSPRGPDRGYEYSTSWSAPPEELVGLAVPERIGVLDSYWGRNPMKLHSEYAGALTLLLAAVGAYVLRRNRYAWFFAFLSLVTLTFALGGHTPVYRLYYEVLPFTKKLRAPSLSLFLLTLSLSVLAGLALDRLAALRAAAAPSRPGREPRGEAASLRTVAYILAVAAGFALLWGILVATTSPDLPSAAPTSLEEMRRARAAVNHPEYLKGVWRFAAFLLASASVLWLWLRRHIPTVAAGVLLALVAVADLWVVGKRFVQAYPGPNVSFAPDEVADFLRRQTPPFRVFDLVGQQDDYLTLFGIELVGGEHGNQLHRYNQFLGEGETTYTDFHNVLSNGAFLGLANARYLVLDRQVVSPLLAPVFQGQTREGQAAIVYENRALLPRAFLVPAAVQVPGPDGALERMLQPGFDPQREVLLYQNPPMKVPEAGAPLTGEARVTRHEPAEVVVDVTSSRPAYLVLTDNYHDDWRARVDGQETPVLQAFHTFRAVPVPAGRHTVRFTFEPQLLRIGLVVSLLTLAALALFGAALAYSGWRRRPSAAT